MMDFGISRISLFMPYILLASKIFKYLLLFESILKACTSANKTWDVLLRLVSCINFSLSLYIYLFKFIWDYSFLLTFFSLNCVLWDVLGLLVWWVYKCHHIPFRVVTNCYQSPGSFVSLIQAESSRVLLIDLQTFNIYLR